MTDHQGWQPPEPDGHPRPHYGEYGPAGPAQQQYPQPGYPQWGPPAPGPGAYPQGPGGSYAPGWAPPPKPGLIPLRPLGFGTLIGAPFQVLRRNPKPTFGSALIIQAIVVVSSILVVGGVSVFAISRIAMARGGDVSAVTAGSVTAIILSALVPVALSLIGSALLQGVIVTEVAHASVGEKLGMRGLWHGIVGRRASLIGWTLLVAAAVVVGIGIVGGLVTVLVLVGSAFIAVGVIVGVFGGLGLVVLAVWLGTKLSLVPSALVLERIGIRAAMGRSWSLTHWSFWRTFGVQALVWIILSTAGQIISFPVSIVYSLATTLIAPTGADSVNGTAIVVAIGAYAVLIVVSLVVSSITAVVQAATSALLYLDLRMRREGLDLALIRFVEERQAGATALVDPFVPAGRP